MNNRLKEIILDITGPVGYIGNWGRVQWADNVYPQLGDDLYARVDLEKLAELIIRECVDMVLDSSVEYTTRPQVAIEIKEHFGVK